MRFHFLILVLLVCCSAPFTMAQVQQTASAEKAMAALQLARQKQAEGLTAEAIIHASDAVRYADAKKDKVFLEAALLLKTLYEQEKQAEEALTATELLIEYARAQADTPAVVRYLKELAEGHNRIGMKEKAMNAYLQISRLKSHPVVARQLPETYNQIGLIFRSQRDFNTAAEYFSRAFNEALARADSAQLAHALNNRGGNFYLSGQYDSAGAYFTKALEIRRMLSDSVNLAKSLNNVGLVMKRQKRYSEALGIYRQALPILRKKGTDADLTALMANIGDIFMFLNIYDSAIIYNQYGIRYAESSGDQNRTMEAYEGIVRVYDKLNDYPNAYRNLMIAYQLKDSVFDSRSAEKITELQARYDTDRKNKEIELLTRQQQISDLELFNRNVQIYAALAFALLILVLLGFLYNRHNLKERALKLLAEQHEEIIRQKAEIEANRDEINRSHSQIRKSINYAKRIQDAMLPRPEQMKTLLPSSMVLFRPRDVVSGDFFWMGEQNGCILIAVADCTGHGVPGAFMSMIGHDQLDQIVYLHGITDPALILDLLHTGVRKVLRQDETDNRDGMDIAVCCIDTRQRALYFAGAKAPLFYVNSQQEGQLIKGDSHPIGGLQREDSRTFTCHQIPLQDPYTVFYLASDGFQDQFGGPENRKYSTRRLRELLVQLAPLPLSQQQERLAAELAAWKGDTEQTDDILLMGFRIS